MGSDRWDYARSPAEENESGGAPKTPSSIYSSMQLPLQSISDDNSLFGSAYLFTETLSPPTFNRTKDGGHSSPSCKFLFKIERYRFYLTITPRWLERETFPFLLHTIPFPVPSGTSQLLKNPLWGAKAFGRFLDLFWDVFSSALNRCAQLL